MIYPIITSFYAALLALLYIPLTWHVIAARRDGKISIGHGGNAELERRIGMHNNFAQFAPIGIALLLLCELMGTPAIALHLLGLMLVVGRVLHARGIRNSTARGRKEGMMLTFAFLFFAGIGLLGHTAAYMIHNGYDQPRDSHAIIEMN